MPPRRVPAGPGQQPEPVVEPGQQLPGGQRPQPPGRQLHGQRDPVQPAAQLPYVRVVRDRHPVQGGPVREQFHRLVLAQRRQREQPLTRHRERSAAHGEHPQPGRPAQ